MSRINIVTVSGYADLASDYPIVKRLVEITGPWPDLEVLAQRAVAQVELDVAKELEGFSEQAEYLRNVKTWKVTAFRRYMTV